jgi:hypothetical protein
MGPDGDPNHSVDRPAVAFNPNQNEYLVVWDGYDDFDTFVLGEREIFGQRVAATTGTEIGVDLRLSDMGPDEDQEYGAYTPAVAYNPTQGEYLVVWYGDDDTGSLVNDEYEIFGQRVAGATGAEIGVDQRLSDMGPNGDPDYDALAPDVAYNPTQDEYLVVWYGDDNTGTLVDNEGEIFGQRVAVATGAEIGGDVRLSDMGPDGDEYYDAVRPAVAYNPNREEYLVTWEGDDVTGSPVSLAYEIYGQRVESTTGAEIGGDLRLSDMGPEGDLNYSAYGSALAYNLTQDEYLVVWEGEDYIFPLVSGEREIFGQRFAPDYYAYLPLVIRD